MFIGTSNGIVPPINPDPGKTYRDQFPILAVAPSKHLTELVQLLLVVFPVELVVFPVELAVKLGLFGFSPVQLVVSLVQLVVFPVRLAVFPVLLPSESSFLEHHTNATRVD